MSQLRIAVIGAGIIGAAVAREITLRASGAQVTVIEKENHPAAHQSGHNSGVVHAGLYYEPGGLKATLCRRGVGLLKEFCADHQIAYEECGKLVVALNDDETSRLHEIHRKAVANGVPDIEIVNRDRIREIEPNASGKVALHSPHTAIVDFPGVTNALVQEVKRSGGQILLSTEVVGIHNYSHHVTVETTAGDFDFDHLIVCGGLQSDRLARMSGNTSGPKIIPFFGQYSQLAPEYTDLVNGLIYPVPDPAYPFLGVHVTKHISGETLVGPNAFLSLGRENYSGWDINLADSLEIAGCPGFWRFASGNIKTAVLEIRSVLSRQSFIRSAAAYVPALADARSEPFPRGIRAQAMNEDGSLVDDFVINHSGRATLVRNAPSPGATSSLAIAEYIVDRHARVHDLAL
jgi:L-2-hydroxyglutarate oxidase